MTNEEILIALQIAELTRELPSLRPIFQKVLKELEDEAEALAKPVGQGEQGTAAQKPLENPMPSIHTSSNPTMVDAVKRI